MNLVFSKRKRLWLKTFVWIFFAMFFSINGLIGQDIFDEKFEQIDEETTYTQQLQDRSRSTWTCLLAAACRLRDSGRTQ